MSGRKKSDPAVRMQPAFRRPVMVAGVIALTPIFAGCWNSKQGRTDEFRGDAYFDVCPDGKGIVYVGPGRGGADIWSLDFATGIRKPILSSGLRKNFPAFGNDDKVLFTAYGANGDWENLYEGKAGTSVQVAADGGRWQRAGVPLADGSLAVVSYSSIVRYGLGSKMPENFNLEMLTPNPKGHRALVRGFSEIMLFPGCQLGNRIVFSGKKQYSDTTRALAVPLAGGDVAPFSELSDVWCVTASPTGRQIAIVGPSAPGEFGHDVFVMDAGGGPTRRLTKMDARIIQARFESGGNSILFVVGQNFAYDLYRVHLDGALEHVCRLVN